MEFSTQIIGLDKFIKATDEARKNAADFSPLFERIYAEIFVPAMSETFLKEGPGWKPINPSYRRWKREMGYRLEVGRRTDDMRKAMALKSRTRGTVRQIKKHYAVFGTSLDYASDFDEERPLRNLAIKRISAFLTKEVANYILDPYRKTK